MVTAQDGDQAIAIFEKLGAHISLVILDLIMPSMDGEDLFNRLRGFDPGISVVLSSGFSSQEKLQRMLGARTPRIYSEAIYAATAARRDSSERSFSKGGSLASAAATRSSLKCA